MATVQEDVVLKIQVQGQERTIDSIKSARQAVKELQSEFLKTGDQQTLKNLTAVKDKLDDIKDATQTASGSGVEKLKGSFALLTEGFANFDGDKIKTAFSGIGGAISAIPIFLLIEGIKLLVENFDVVINVAKVFLGITEDNVKAANRLVEALDRESAAINDLMQISDRFTKTELLNAKLRGATDEELTKITEAGYKRKIKAAKEYLEESTRIYNALLANDEAESEQIKKAGEELLKANQSLKNLVRDQGDFEIQNQIDVNAKKEEERKKELERIKAYREKVRLANEAADRNVQEALDRVENARIKEVQTRNASELKAAQERLNQAKKDEAELIKLEEETTASFLVLDKTRTDESKKNAEERKAVEEQISQQSFAAAKLLSDAYFQQQLNSAKGNAKAQEEIAKKQFNINKSFQLAEAAILGIKATLSAYAETPGGPIIKAVAAAVSAAFSLASIAKIATVQYNGGGSSSSATAPSASAPSAPTLPQQNTNQGQTIILPEQRGTVNAVVIETQLTNVQNRVSTIEENATF